MFSDNTVVNSPTSPDHQDIFDGVAGLKKKSFDADDDDGGGEKLEKVFPGHPQNRATSGTSSQQSNVPSTILTSTEIEDPFVAVQSASVSGYASSKLFTEPFEQNDVHSHSRSKKVDVSSGSSGNIFDSIDPNVTMVKSKPLFSSGVNNEEKDGTHLRTSPHWTHNSGVREPTGKSSGKISENPLLKKVVANNFGESHQSPSVSVVSHQAFTQNDSHKSTSFTETTSHMGMSPKFKDNSEAADDVWLTVSEVTLTTFPTRAPPPSRPPRPPPRSQQIRKEVRGSSVQSKITSGFSSFYHSSKSYWRSRSVTDPVKSSGVSSINGFEDFAMGGPQSNADEPGVVISNEVTANLAAEASAAAMKEAMDRAEIKFKLSREVRDRENAVKRNGPQWDRDERVMQNIQEQDLREKQEILDQEQESRERDEEERELRKSEKEREHALEIERERERGRQAVDRATKEARRRATVEARQKAERAAVDKVNAEAREQAAVQEAQTEARERAATLARERAEKAASDAMERKSAEDKEKAAAVARAEKDARIRADRASVNKATAEARQRAAFSAAAAAAAAAASATRGNQPKNENDLDSFFNTGVRSDSTSRPSSSDSAFEAQLHNKPGAEGSQQSFTGNSSGVRKSSTTIDDLTSIFGANSSFGDFQEMGGETDERRKTRLERHQRTQERTEKALADKNERDRHTQWEQSERQRIGESLDFEIKRWSAGKEGNLRALLSTLQYVLWPECGWQAVSLTDLITPASVKKVYRKANLCVHPDKLQQKGANLQQKYIAEKVFDLLQEAWTKLNSEELL